MKIAMGFLLSIVATTSFAASMQKQTCTINQIEKEAQEFIRTADESHQTVHLIQDCLLAALKKDAAVKKSSIPQTVRSRVLEILAEIEHAKMVGAIKCETSGTPGCLSGEKDEVILGNERMFFPAGSELDKDADQKSAHPLDGKDW